MKFQNLKQNQLDSYIGKIFNNRKILSYDTKKLRPNQDIRYHYFFNVQCLQCNKIKSSDIANLKAHGCLTCTNKNRVWPTVNPEDRITDHLLLHYNKKGTDRNYTFELNREEFKSFLFKNCYYCNLEPSNEYRYKRKFLGKYNGIDRVDNNLGYILTNCVTCCKMCNRNKRNYSKEVFLEWIKKVYNFQFNK